jgi:hypothetical protein
MEGSLAGALRQGLCPATVGHLLRRTALLFDRRSHRGVADNDWSSDKPADEAFALAQKFEFHDAPKVASCLLEKIMRTLIF